MKQLIKQFVLMLVLCVLMCLARPVSALYGILVWVIVPLCGAVTAFYCVRKDVNPYVSWIMPPIAELIAFVLITMGYAPQGGMTLLTVFTSLIGAAAGDTYTKIQRKEHEKRIHR